MQGSLENTLSGWHFTLRNTLGSGYAKGMVPLKLDDTIEIPMTSTSFESEGETFTFDQVSDDNTFGLKMNREIVITIDGEQLTSGSHDIYFGCIIPGLGQIGFDFTDDVANG